MTESVNFAAWRGRHFGEFRADCARYLEVSRAWLWLLEQCWVEPSKRVQRLMDLLDEKLPDMELRAALETTLDRLQRSKEGRR